jgi:2-amino-4-hydroxy-6-hydroxymethyldihydropteridine diphosphokinase
MQIGDSVHTVYLALGTNVGDRAGNLHRALDALVESFDIAAVSPVYETEPAYQLDQPRFYNQYCRATTKLSSQDALAHLKATEVALGRVPGPRNGPRSIDIDLLFYDDLALATPGLTVPHPLLHERAFVLVPLNDVGADVRHPTLELTVRQLLNQLPEAEKKKVWPVR